ncbi:MAG TPA: TetR family transcriptional regulator, partial [Arthrobacter sp.]|nr:TetR family transcriptional regulator [Arthrobacter sp.]
MSDAAAEAETAPRTPRERARAQTIADIVRLGRDHLATQGAAALSLRAVARDLGVVSSAVYRYVANRDELLTLLLVDAYEELGDAVDVAVDSMPSGDHAGQFKALGRAVREWA